jgi:hypothetical protein
MVSAEPILDLSSNTIMPSSKHILEDNLNQKCLLISVYSMVYIYIYIVYLLCHMTDFIRITPQMRLPN